MRTAVIFFLFLCFYLVGGNVSVHAIVQRGESSTQSIAKAGQVRFANPANRYTIIENNGLKQEISSLIDVEDEDEEHITRKQTLLTRYALAFSYTFILFHRDNSLTVCLPFHKDLSYLGSPKYIVQRALII